MKILICLLVVQFFVGGSVSGHYGAQIIVLPEDGLTGNVDTQLLQQKISTEVPHPSEGIAPCDHGNYTKFFTDLSCAARKSSIYVVVNLIEQRRDSRRGKVVFHNTNVAFNRNGVVIARYRKINSPTEPFYESGQHTTFFKTDFDVTFGLFTSLDILYKNPAKDVLSDPEVTDIVYPTRWFSKTPFYTAISIQHGYSKSNAVNLLAAGLNSPENGYGGSGIYLYDGRIAEIFISGGSKLIVQDVPKIGRRGDVSNFCQPASSLPQVDARDFFETQIVNLQNYTFKAVNLDSPAVSETICSGQSGFCCSFNITVDKYAQPNYVYKLVAFYGTTLTFGNTALGEGNCGLVACLNENNDSCGRRLLEAPRGVRFDQVVVTGKFDAKNSFYQPSTLTYDLLPLTDYMFCKTTTHDEEELMLKTTKSQETLLAFGLKGRVYEYDNRLPGLSQLRRA